MTTPRDVLTPEAFALLETIDHEGSMAAAARRLGLVPSALSYRTRQLEETLDVLLLDRRAKRVRLTPAGQALLQSGQRLLADIDALARRVQRVATGWESEFTLAVDGVIDRHTVLDLCEAFYALGAPTHLRLREETLNGTLEALTRGEADLALGVPGNPGGSGTVPGIHSLPIGQVEFVFALAPQHPLAKLPQPLSDAQIRPHRAVAVADTVRSGHSLTVGLLPGQEVLTVSHLQQKIEAQARGLGVGFVPKNLARDWFAQGRLVPRSVERAPRLAALSYAWRIPDGQDGERGGRALQWWLKQLKSPTTRQALLHEGRARARSKQG